MADQELVNMNVYVPEPLRRRVKAHAASRGMTMSDFVTKVITKVLDERDAEQGPRWIGIDGEYTPPSV
jgi:hypothetical protein